MQVILSVTNNVLGCVTVFGRKLSGVGQVEVAVLRPSTVPYDIGKGC